MAISRIKFKQAEPSTIPGALVASDTSLNYQILNPTAGADHLWFYDHSATATLPLTIGAGFTVTGTSIAVTGAGSGYSEVREEGIAVGSGNTKIDFIGSGLTAADATGGVTSVTVATFLNTLATAGAVSLTAHVSGILPVANGGTALASGTSGGILGYTGTGTIASSALLTDSVIMVGGGAGATPTSSTILYRAG